MNKIVKGSLALLAALCVGNMTASAKTMTATDIEDISKYTIEGLDEEAQENVYILGKHVHFTMITYADMMAVITNNNFDGELADAVLYRKDTAGNWSDGATGEAISASKVAKLEFEMVRLVGNFGDNGHVSEDPDLYASGGDYINKVTPSTGRAYDEFVDTTADLSVVSVRTLPAGTDLGSAMGNASNDYNSKAITSTFAKKQEKGETKYSLSFNETAPLLTFAQNDTDHRAKWVVLLVQLNKNITRNMTVSYKLGDKSVGVTVTPSDIEAATRLGGNGREFLLWLPEDASETWVNSSTTLSPLNGLSKITFTLKEPEKESLSQEIAVSLTTSKVQHLYSVTAPTDGSELVADIPGEEVNYISAKVGNKYYFGFYSNNDKLKKFEFTLNGDKKRAVGELKGWTIGDLISLDLVEAAKETAQNDIDYKWNQQAIKDGITVETANSNEYDYIVEVAYNKELRDLGSNKDVALVLDLSVAQSNLNVKYKDNQTLKPDTSVASGVVTSYGATGDAFVYWLDKDTSEKIVTFTNNSGVNADKVTVKFVLKDDTTKMTLNAKPSAAVALYPGTMDEDEGKANANYLHNMDAFTFSSSEKNGVYTITLQQKEKGSDGLLNVQVPHGTGNNKFSGNLYGIVMDLGVDPTKLTVNDGYEIDTREINATKFGADTSTQFVFWFNDDSGKTASTATEDVSKEVTFKNNDNDVVLKVKIIIKYISAEQISDITGNGAGITSTVVDNIVIAPEYQGDVTVDPNNNLKFTINKGVTKFVATATITTTANDGTKSTTTHDYTYNIDGTQAKRIQNLTLSGNNSVYAAQYDSKHQYNQDAIKPISVDGNVINVTFNKNIDGPYALLLDLGLGEYNNDIYKYNSSNRYTTPLEIASENRFTGNKPENMKNLVVIWCDTNNSSTTDGEKFSFVHHTDNDTSVPYEIVVKSYVDKTNDSDEFKLAEPDEVVIDPQQLQEDEVTRIGTNAGKYTTKQEGLNKVVITYNKLLKQYCSVKPGSEGVDDSAKCTGASGEYKTWFGVLVDLGINPSYIADNAHVVKDGVAISASYKFDTEGDDERNPENVTKFGGTSDTQFLMWLDTESFNDSDLAEEDEDGNKTLTFEFKHNSNNNDDPNKYGEAIRVTFVLVDDMPEISEPQFTEVTTDSRLTGATLDRFKLNQGKASYAYDAETKTLTITRAKIDEFQKYARPGTSDASPKWYVIDVDFGKKLNAVGESGYRPETFEDSTNIKLWVNFNTEKSTGVYNFTDTDTGKEFKLTVKIVEVDE